MCWSRLLLALSLPVSRGGRRDKRLLLRAMVSRHEARHHSARAMALARLRAGCEHAQEFCYGARTTGI